MYVLLFDLDCTENVKGGFYYDINNKNSGFLSTVFGKATVIPCDENFESLIDSIKKKVALELNLLYGDKWTNVAINGKITYTDKEFIIPQALMLTTMNRLEKVGVKLSKKIDIDYVIEVLEANDYWCKKIPLDIPTLLATI